MCPSGRLEEVKNLSVIQIHTSTMVRVCRYRSNCCSVRLSGAGCCWKEISNWDQSCELYTRTRSIGCGYVLTFSLFISPNDNKKPEQRGRVRHPTREREREREAADPLCSPSTTCSLHHYIGAPSLSTRHVYEAPH